MKTQLDRPPFSTITGTMMQLSARDTIAIYVWDGLSWVAHFHEGRAELSDAATWFGAHAAWLRSGRVGSLAAVDTTCALPPEMIERIGRLHQQVEEARARQAAPSAAMLAVRRAGSEIASALHHWSARLHRRAS